MQRGGTILLALAFCLAVAPVAHAQDRDLQQALALQRTMQNVIAQVEPSIACILVSRSDGYQRVAQQPPPEAPGRLGTFDATALERNPELSPEKKIVWRKKLDLADPAYVPQSFGSGVVLDAAGLILTNFHVVQDATKIFVRLPGGKSSYADIHAADPRTDFAILRVLNNKIFPLTPIPLGDADKMERGQFVLSIANPFAVGFRDGQPSASWGILSNIRRRTVTQPREDERAKPLYQYGSLLQTDARLHLGCSGGALVNLQGELVGLTTALAAIQGGETPGGFALPLNLGMRRILAVLKRGEEVDYGFLGVAFQEKAPEGTPGIPLAYVTPGSPADADGQLHQHDLILAIDDLPMRDSNDLFVHLGTRLAGDKVKLRVRRLGERTSATVDVTLAKLYVPGKRVVSSLGGRPFTHGLRVDYSSLLAQQPPRALLRVPAGVLITDVVPESAADRARLKPGEVVTHVNQQPVLSPDVFYQTIGRLSGPYELTLYSFTPQEAPSKVTLRQ